MHAGSAPAVLRFVHQMSNGTSHSLWLSRLEAGLGLFPADRCLAP